MTLDESRFSALADETLDTIAEAIDDAVGDEVEVETQGGILTLSIAGAGQYVINKHAPNRQIWMSSPVSGATHFDWNGAEWVSTRDAEVKLGPMLARELEAHTGRKIAL